MRRTGAENYLLIILLSFATSVAATRLFLEITGYPRLAGGNIHIAHVLWGGLLLFIAVLLPLLLLNRWAKVVAALLAGIGVGLFIDEVGKFVTAENDYFHPVAAPIIYAFFMLVVFLYTQLRSPSGYDLRSELYWSLDTFGEILDRDLDAGERDAIRVRLARVIRETDSSELRQLAQELLDFIDSDVVQIATGDPDLVERFTRWWRRQEDRWLTLPRLRVVLIIGLLVFGAVDLINLSILTGATEFISSGHSIPMFLMELGFGVGGRGSIWFEIRALLEAIVGIAMIVAALLMVIGREKEGVRLGEVALLVSFTVVNLFVFYFEQFSSIILAFIQFLLLLAVFHYQGRLGRTVGGEESGAV